MILNIRHDRTSRTPRWDGSNPVFKMKQKCPIKNKFKRKTAKISAYTPQRYCRIGQLPNPPPPFFFTINKERKKIKKFANRFTFAALLQIFKIYIYLHTYIIYYRYYRYYIYLFGIIYLNDQSMNEKGNLNLNTNIHLFSSYFT